MPLIRFENAGDSFYGPTREWSHTYRHDEEGRSRSQGTHVHTRRNGDVCVNALHYMLRDRGCSLAWQKVLPEHDCKWCAPNVQVCPPWYAPPCEASGLIMLAVLAQWSPAAGSYLQRFVMESDDQVAPCFSVLLPTQLLSPSSHRSSSTTFAVMGFSKGAYTAVYVHRLIQLLSLHALVTVETFAGALACPPSQLPVSATGLTLVQVVQDAVCKWDDPEQVVKYCCRVGAQLILVDAGGAYYAREILGSE